MSLPLTACWATGEGDLALTVDEAAYGWCLYLGAVQRQPVWWLTEADFSGCGWQVAESLPRSFEGYNGDKY